MKKILILVLGTVALAGCHERKPIEQAPQTVQAIRLEAQPGSTSAAMRFSAMVAPDAQVPLAFRIPGYVVALKQVRGVDGRMRDLAEGDRVSRGAVLVRIRSAEYEDKVHQASSHASAADAQLQKAKFDFERATRLYETQSLTKPEYDAARAQYDTTQAELKAARAATSEAEVSLRDTSITAPFDGDVVKKSVELGSFVGSEAPAFTLAKTDVLKIVIGVPDIAVRNVKLGQLVDITVDAFAQRTFRARISRISSAADSRTRNFDVEVAIPNRDHLLKVGMIASLQLTGSESVQQQPAYQVPLAAIVQVPDGRYGIFAVSSSGTGTIARLRPVEIGSVNGTDIAVIKGLANGDEVITAGANLLKDGQSVEVVK